MYEFQELFYKSAQKAIVFFNKVIYLLLRKKNQFTDESPSSHEKTRSHMNPIFIQTQKSKKSTRIIQERTHSHMNPPLTQ